MRSPASGLRPVVSVSKTISRTPALCERGAFQTRQDAPNRLSRFLQVAAGRDDEIGALALLFIGHLVAEDALELGLRHSGPRQDSGALDLGRGRNDGDLV